MLDHDDATTDPLGTEEAPLAAPPRVPPPPVPTPDPEPIPLDEPDGPIVATPDRPDQGPIDPASGDAPPAELPAVDPSGSPPSADPGGLMALAGRLDGVEASLGRKLDALQAAFDREVRAEATREKVVDRLHAELQEYKQGLILGILRPVFTDLIQLHDDIGKMVAASTATATPDDDAPAEVVRLLGVVRSYQQAVEDILVRQGVETFTHDGDAFDPRRQRALSTVPTDDPALNKRVAARVRKGFHANDKVLRPEFVTVYAHKG